MDRSIEKLNKLIREEILRGVPAWSVTEAAEEACSYLKKVLLKGIMQRSLSQPSRANLTKELDQMLNELEKELESVIQDKIDEFVYEI